MSARAHLTVPAVALLLALVLAGCGPPPPQPPPAQDARLSDSLGGIATDCGLAYQSAAFGRRPTALAALDRQAAHKARELALVFHADPQWIYQGSTVRQVVAQSVAYLHACGLLGAATSLQRQTG